MRNPITSTIIILILVGSSLPAATHYVSLGSTNPQRPYATWATAATNIQDAVDASSAGDTVLVTNGLYTVGERNGGLGPTRVVITNATALRSINGPQLTVIDGGGGVRCAYLADDASLSGFSLTNGVSPLPGGGVRGTSRNTLVTNCVISGNSPYYYSGAYSCTLYNCTLSGIVYGGGANSCTLSNCTLTGNGAARGGGANSCALYDCTVTGNVAGGGAYSCTLSNCTLSGNSGGGHLSARSTTAR